jgi:hypothetical protein
MRKISSASMKCMRLCHAGIVMLSAASLSIASTGCIDPTVPDEAQALPLLRLTPADLAEALVVYPRGGTTAVTANGVAQATGFSFCVGPYAIEATGSNRYVTAQVNYDGGDYGMLRAAATSIGNWELFGLCGDSNTGPWSLRSLENEGFATVQVNYGGSDNAMLRAEAVDVGPWERFTIYSSDTTINGILSFQSMQNGLAVAAEFGYTGGDNGMLRARTNIHALGDWESFQLIHR